MNPQRILPLNFRWFATVLLAALVFGCGEKRDAAKASRIDLREIQSTAELRRIFVAGMTTNEILARVGEPLQADEFAGDITWTYSLSGFPADDEMRGTYVAAARLTITNGHLARWGCVYFGPPTGGNAKTLPLGQANEVGGQRPALKMFVVSDQPIADGRQIDTAQFPKLGFISATPDLAIKKLKGLEFEEIVAQVDNKTSTNWQFVIRLSTDDAAGLASLTTSNVDKTVLITVGDVPVSAPVIREPVETGSFILNCDEWSKMETVKSHLTRMEQAQ